MKSEVDIFQDAKDKILLERIRIENEEHLQELIANLEKLQREWQDNLRELQEQKEQYHQLINDAKKIKQIIVDDALKFKFNKISRFKIRILSRKKK